MLTVEEREEIEAKLADYPNTQAVCIEAMLIIQRHQGWVSDEKLRDLSELLRLSLADLDGVATFYNLIRRRPVGRQVGHPAWWHNLQRALYRVAHRLPGSV